MRHLKAGKRLGVTTAHRRAMMRNLVTSLLENEQITCTLTRAKELRKPLDKMITLGKRGDLHARRQALTFVKSKNAMSTLFGELAERYQERNGGYSRIIKIANRRLGDGAQMAIVQLLDGPNDVLSTLKKKSTPKQAKSSDTILSEVSQQLSTETDQGITEDKISEATLETHEARSQVEAVQEKEDSEDVTYQVETVQEKEDSEDTASQVVTEQEQESSKDKQSQTEESIFKRFLKKFRW